MLITITILFHLTNKRKIQSSFAYYGLPLDSKLLLSFGPLSTMIGSTKYRSLVSIFSWLVTDTAIIVSVYMIQAEKDFPGLVIAAILPNIMICYS